MPILKDRSQLIRPILPWSQYMVCDCIPPKVSHTKYTTHKQVRAKAYILGRSLPKVHSVSMDQPAYIGRPESSGQLVFPAL